MRAIARRIARAREHPTDFFNFVMYGEVDDRRKLTADAHQRVLFDFVMHHQRCVLRLPPSFSKTFTMASLMMWLLGRNPTARGAIVSSTLESAKKPLGMVRDYIERPTEFPELRLVFPKLTKSSNPHDPWTQSRIVVERPPGIRDPSFVALGVGGALLGSRLSMIVVDDVLDEENTRTVDSRKIVNRWFHTTVLSRLDVQVSKIVVCNTPWNDDKTTPDLTYALERASWPTLAMNAEGDIEIINAPDFDTDDIRPSKKPGEVYRLAAHDPDPREVIPLWPEKFGEDELNRIRESYRHQPHIYAQLYKLRSYAHEGSRCKVEWIDAAKQAAQAAGVYGTVQEYRGGRPVFTGIDLAVGKKQSNDMTTFFTFMIREDNKRVVLDAESGRFGATEIVAKIIEKHKRYGGMVRVENNAAQDYIRQFTLDANIAVPITGHTTGANKADARFGVESLFVELANGVWLIPCGPTGEVDPGIEQWIEDCLSYRPPPAHTGDMLMASWFAREEARYCGFMLSAPALPGSQRDLGIAGMMMR